MANKAVVATKVGMTQLWDDENRVVPVTMLQVEPCRVVQVKTDERDGYTAVQVTFGQREASKLSKPEAGHFESAGVEPGQRLVELRIDDVSEIEIGQELAADVLEAGEKVDVTAVSKGKGFAGVMKRHNFSGQKSQPRRSQSSPSPGRNWRMCDTFKSL
jgi:large subunit ribosomal protein L3